MSNLQGISAVFKREMRSLFVSPGVYVALAAFVLLITYFFFSLVQYYHALVGAFNAAPMQGSRLPPNISSDIVEPFLRFVALGFVFLLPLLSMRTIVEERNNGTLEMLYISPLCLSQIILGKFSAVLAVISIVLLFVCVFPLVLFFLGGVELAAFIAGIFGLLLYAMALASVSLAVAAVSPNQLVAAAGSMILLLLLYVSDVPVAPLHSWLSSVLEYCTPRMHVDQFILGVVATPHLVYFASVSLLGLYLAHLALNSERWRS